MAPKRNLHTFEANEQKVISHVINEQVDRKVLIEAFLLHCNPTMNLFKWISFILLLNILGFTWIEGYCS